MVTDDLAVNEAAEVELLVPEHRHGGIIVPGASDWGFEVGLDLGFVE